MGNIDDGFRISPKEKKEVVFDSRQEFNELSRESEELYGVFSVNFAKLAEAAEEFGDIDVKRAKYLTLQTYMKKVSPVVSKFLKAMNGCKRACVGLEKKYRNMVSLANEYPELLKWDRFVEETKETELRTNDVFVKLEKYKKMLPDVEVVVDAWPDPSYHPLKAMYQTAQRPVILVWKKFIGEKSTLNKLAARARHNLEGVVHNFIMEDGSGDNE